MGKELKYDQNSLTTSLKWAKPRFWLRASNLKAGIRRHLAAFDGIWKRHLEKALCMVFVVPVNVVTGFPVPGV